jgi:hypothetical protein
MARGWSYHALGLPHLAGELTIEVQGLNDCEANLTACLVRLIILPPGGWGGVGESAPLSPYVQLVLPMPGLHPDVKVG